MSNDNATPKPYVVENSGRWLGSGGRWSTFYAHVGTPAQHFHVLPSFAGQTVYVPIDGDCSRMNISDCGESRGVEVFNSLSSPGFQRSASSSWTQIGMYGLQMGQTHDTSATGMFGFETVGLGTSRSTDGFQFNKLAVAAYAGPTVWVGQLGLSPFAMNFSEEAQPPHSFISSLKEKRQIPSLSFGYQAGAAYRFTKVPGHLVLGGYDRSRSGNKTLMLSSRQDLIVGVQTISSKTADGKDVILSPNGGILATIDTGTDEIWLPRAMCDMFASTFNLTYFDEADRYIVTDAAHSELLRTKPSVTFRLGNGISGGEAIDIELPYDAFDLVGTYPLFGKPTNYFPLRRAQNSTQYALGRTFLQEAYLSVDFERDTFNLSQATFTAQAVPADVVTIEPKDKSVDNLTKLGSTSNNSKLSHGAIVGIAIGAVFLLFVVLGSWLYRRRKRAKKYAGAAQELPDNEKAEPNQSELANCEKTEVNPFELDAIVEAPGTLSLTAELEHRGIVELYSPHGASEVDDVEKFGSHIIGTTKEVPPSPVYELPSPDMDKFVKRG